MFTATGTLFKVLWKENVGDNFFVYRGSVVDAGNDALTEYCGDIVGSIRLAVFVVDVPGNICILFLVKFHVEYLSLYVS